MKTDTLLRIFTFVFILGCSSGLFAQNSIANLYGALARVDTDYSSFTFSANGTSIQDTESSYHINGMAYRNGYYYVVRSRPDASNDQKLLIISESAEEVVQTLALDASSTHPGGIQIYDNILLIPFEYENQDSKLCFYNLDDPTAPVLAGEYTVAGVGNAVCAGITEYNGNYLVAHYYSRSGYVRFYHFDSSFNKITHKTWRAPNDTDKSNWYPLTDWPSDTYNYESMNLVKTDEGYFMIMYHSTNGADIYSINDAGLTSDLDLDMVYRLNCNPYDTGFRYAAGLTITDSENICFFSALKHVHSNKSENVISRFVPDVNWPWKLTYEYDTGGQTDVGIDENNNCIEMHFGSPGGSKENNIFTRVGNININTNKVEWGSSTNTGALGSFVAVSFLENNYCVEVHQGYDSDANKHYYRVGEVNTSAKTVSWGTVTQYDTGGQFAIATDNSNHIVEVHRGSEGGSNENNHYYRVGLIDSSSKTISWGSSVKFGSGGFISLALDNNGNCVELHRGEPDGTTAGNLYYRVGSVSYSSKTISWGNSTLFDTGGNMEITLADDNRIMEVHRGKGTTTQYKHYYRFGTVDTTAKTISWENNTAYDTAVGDFRIAANNNGNGIEIHLGAENESDSNVHYYRTFEADSGTALKSAGSNLAGQKEILHLYDKAFWFYPNPSNDKITLIFTPQVDGECSVQITDMMGSVVLHKQMGNCTKGQKFTKSIGLKGIVRPGNYLLSIIGPVGLEPAQKLIVF